jgi:hypothetical protein
VTRYAFVVRWPDGREPELATRDGRLVVSTDKTVLCPPYEAVVFSGDPAGTVGVTDDPPSDPPLAVESQPAVRGQAEHTRLRVPDGPMRKFSYWVQFTPEQYTDVLEEACLYMGINSTGLSDEEMHQRIDERMGQLHAAVDRAWDAAFPTTPDQLPGHPLVQPEMLTGRGTPSNFASTSPEES